MEIVVEFFLHLVAMERILVVFLRIRRKSQQKRIMIERGDLLFADLWRKLQANGFHEFVLFYYIDRLQLTAVYCNRRGVKRQHLKRPVFAM